MVIKKLNLAIFIVLALLLVMTACAPTFELNEPAQTAVALTLTAMVPPTETIAPTATSTPEPTATSTPTFVPTPLIEPSGPDNFPTGVNPLTGLAVADPSLLNRRPVLVKVSNYPAVGRPHAGLSFADIVFEYYMGVGANRFMGLYYGKDSNQIGPVRSGRLVDPQLTSMYQGILGFQSADARVYSNIISLLGNRAITGGPNTCPGICDDGRNIVISVFGDSEALTNIAASRGAQIANPVLTGMRFDQQPPQQSALPGAELSLTYGANNVGQWVYDQGRQKYMRWIDEVDSSNNMTMIPLVDRLTGEQLAFSNVIVLYAYYTEQLPTLHDIDVWDNSGGRRAVVFRDGQAYETTWRATSRYSPIQFFDKDGNIIPLKPGNSWMAFVGTNSSGQVTDGNWTFVNYIP